MHRQISNIFSTGGSREIQTAVRTRSLLGFIVMNPGACNVDVVKFVSLGYFAKTNTCLKFRFDPSSILYYSTVFRFGYYSAVPSVSPVVFAAMTWGVCTVAVSTALQTCRQFFRVFAFYGITACPVLKSI